MNNIFVAEEDTTQEHLLLDQRIYSAEGPEFDQGKISHKTINTYGESPPSHFCRNTFKTIYIYVKVTIFF